MTPQIMFTWASKRDSYKSNLVREWEHEFAKYDIPSDLDTTGFSAFLRAIDNDGHLRGTGDLDRVSRVMTLVAAYARKQATALAA